MNIENLMVCHMCDKHCFCHKNTMYIVKHSISYKEGIYKDSRGWMIRGIIHDDSQVCMERVPDVNIPEVFPDCKLVYYEDKTETVGEYFNGDCACAEFPQYFVKQSDGTILCKHPYFNGGSDIACKKSSN